MSVSVTGVLGRRFWWLYLAGWVPYLGVYASMFVLTGEAPTGLALLAASYQVVPSALLGMGIVWAACRIPWSPTGWPRALGIHGALALAYATISAWTSWLLFSLTWSWFAGRVVWQKHQPGVLVWQCFMALMIYAIIASVTYAFVASKRLREEEHRVARAEALRTKAELQALRAQLNPHFLFNTLHSLLALVRADSSAAEDAIEQFADLLRYASRVHHQPGDEVALVEEWEFVRNYLALESLRIGEIGRAHV